MRGVKLDLTKDGRAIILQIDADVNKINWRTSDALSVARKTAAKTADRLCEIFRDAATKHGISLSTYIRNLIAVSSKNEISTWTAFLYYAVTTHKTEFADLKETATFLSKCSDNCAFLFQLFDKQKNPSFESAVDYFQNEPEKGLELGRKILGAENAADLKIMVNKFSSVHKLNNKILSAKYLTNAWGSYRLPKLDYAHFRKLPASLQHDILSSRICATSILDSTTIEYIKSDKKACRQSPLYAFFCLKDKGLSLKKAISNQKWSYSGLIPLITVFFTEEVKEAVINSGRKDGYGQLASEDILAIPDRRMKNAFLFANTVAKSRLLFFEKLTLQEKIDLIEDIPTPYWTESFATIHSVVRFKSIFAGLNGADKLEELLKRHLLGSHKYPNSDKISNEANCLLSKEQYTKNIEKAYQNALFLAGDLGFFDIVHEAISKKPSRYQCVFEEKHPRLIKTVVLSANTNEHLADYIRVYGDTFIKNWIDISPSVAIKRLGQLLSSNETSISLSFKKDVLKAVVRIVPKRLKNFFKPQPDMELFGLVFSVVSPSEVESIKNLINLKGADGRFVWERLVEQHADKHLPISLEKLLGNGKQTFLKKAYELSPDTFYRQAVKRLPLKYLLPTAMRHPKTGLFIEKVHPRTRLIKEIKWVRETFQDKPTVSTAYEAALALSLPDASYLLHLATLRWKDRNSRQPGHTFDHLYRTYQLPKKSGGTRVITAPDQKLKRLQRRILRNGFEKIAVHSAAHGFLKERSILTNASRHTGQKMVINVDIAGFFPNTRHGSVVQACKQLAGGRLAIGAVMLVADICSFNGALPTGAPTSPYIGNIVLHPADKAIEKVSRRNGINYTRYADDLTFSGGDHVKRILPFARKVLLTFGYNIDPKKTNLFRRGRRQMVTGLVVNEKPNVPRYIKKKIRAAAHRMQNGKTPHWHDKPAAEEKILGLIAHLNVVDPKAAAKYKNQAKKRKSNRKIKK